MSRLILVALSCGILLDGAKCMELRSEPAIQQATPAKSGTYVASNIGMPCDVLPSRGGNLVDGAKCMGQCPKPAIQQTTPAKSGTYVASNIGRPCDVVVPRDGCLERLTHIVNVLDAERRDKWIVRLVVAFGDYVTRVGLPEVRAFELADLDFVGSGFNKWLMQQVIVNYEKLLDIDETGELKEDDAKLQSSETFDRRLTFEKVFNCIVNAMIKREEGVHVSSDDEQQEKFLPVLAIRQGITQVRERTHQHVVDFFNRINEETNMSASPLMGKVQEIDHSRYAHHYGNIVDLLDEKDMDELIVGLIIAFADYISKGDVSEVTAYEVADLSVTSPEFSHWLKDKCFRSYKKLLAIDTTGKLREVHGKLSSPGRIGYECYPIAAWDRVVEVMKDREAYRHTPLSQKMSEEKTIDGCCLQRNPRVYPLHAIEEVIAEKKEKITKHVCDLLDNYK